MKTSRVPLQSSELLTINIGDQPNSVADKFVRVRPLSSSTDAEIRAFKRALLKAGAVAVRVMPRPPASAVQLSEQATKLESMCEDDSLPPVRELMREMVKQSTSKRKKALVKLLDQLADEVGL